MSPLLKTRWAYRVYGVCPCLASFYFPGSAIPVIGDMVNVAQRLQALARGGEILIGASTLPHVQPLVTVYDTVETQVKGRRQPVRVHRIGPL